MDRVLNEGRAFTYALGFVGRLVCEMSGNVEECAQSRDGEIPHRRTLLNRVWAADIAGIAD